MDPYFPAFLRRLLLFSLPLGIPALVFAIFAPETWITPALPFLFVFFISSTLLSYRALLRAAQNRFMVFVNAFMLSIVIKLLGYAVVLVAYALWNRPDAVPFMLTFLVLYLAYSIFEAIGIIRVTRGKEHPGAG